MIHLFEIVGMKDSKFANTVFAKCTTLEIAKKALAAMPEEYSDELEIRRSNLALNTIELDGKIIDLTAGMKKKRRTKNA